MPSSVFIASTVDSLKIAKEIQSQLSAKFICKLWPVATFDSGESALESLLAETGVCDFAVIVLTADDIIQRKKSETTFSVPRDNVIFEAGMFIATLGRERVAFCYENPPGPTLPTDLAGQNLIEFSMPKDASAHDFQHVIAGISSKITKSFHAAGARRTTMAVSKQRMDESPLEFGDARHTDIVVDSAFQTTDRRGLASEIQRSINSKRVFPTKLFYATEAGATAWLELTRDADYRFFRASVSNLRRQVSTIMSIVSNNLEGVAPDLVSLGCGDGIKDAILLSEAAKQMGDRAVLGKISYFPLDYSFHLITETVRTTSQSLDPECYRIKPIVGDIVDLPSFRYVYESYPNPNLFTILGNTIGNNDEQAIMNAIRSALLPGDMVLLEVNTNIEGIKKSRKKDFIVGQKNMRHAFAPLDVLGVKFEADRFSWQTRNKVSSSPEAVSVEASYKMDDKQVISVSVNHRYKFEEFVEWASNSTDTDVVWSLEEKSVGLLLLRRPQN